MAEENRRFGEKFALRMPDGMRGRLASVALENNRSMNAEIVARLEASFAHEDALRPELSDLAAQMDQLGDKVGTLRGNVQDLQMDNAGLKADNAGLKVRVIELEKIVVRLSKRVGWDEQP